MDICLFRQCDFDESFVLSLAQDNADRGVFIIFLDVPIEVIDIHLHLSEVLMGQLADLEIDQDIAAQQSVIENKINKEMIRFESETLLAGFE